MSEAGEVNDTSGSTGPWDKLKSREQKPMRLPKSAINELSIPVSPTDSTSADSVKSGESAADVQKAQEAQNHRILNSKLNANAAEFIPLSNQNQNSICHEDETQKSAVRYLKDKLMYLTLNPGEYDELIQPLYEVIEPYVSNENALQSFITVILDECISEPNLRYTGARICSDLTKKFGSKFREVLLKRCQEEHKAFLDNESTTYANYMNRLQGFGMLLAELFLQIQVGDKSIPALGQGLLKILQIILNEASEKGVKSVCQILKLAGARLDEIAESKPELDKLFTRLQSFCANYVDMDPNLRFIVTSVLNMRASKWGESGSQSQSSTTTGTAAAVEIRPDPENVEDPVFFGPDGQVITEEETSFLHDSVPISDDTDDYICDQELMNEEVYDDFQKFLKLNQS